MPPLLFRLRPGPHLPPDPARIGVAADFNGWEPAALPMQRAPDGGWIGAAACPLPGLHRYRFVADGVWITDPENPLSVDNGSGGRDSVIVTGNPPPGSPDALRVLTLNLHTWQEPEAHRKLEEIAVAAAALEIDVLLLQEVGAHLTDPARPDAGLLLRGHLQRSTRRPWYIEGRTAHIGFGAFREGLAILSAVPLTDPEEIVLSGGGLRRIAVAATADVRGRAVRFVSAHLSWEPERAAAESGRLLAALGDAPDGEAPGAGLSVLIGGDFNCAPAAPPVRALLSRGFVDVGAACGVTLPTFPATGERLDLLLLRAPGGGMRPLAARRVFDGTGGNGGLPVVSDHAGVICALG